MREAHNSEGPRFGQITSTNMIKMLGVSAEEYKKFNKHVMRLASKGYDVEEIDSYEYVIQARAKRQFREQKIPRNNYPNMNTNTEETAEDAAWN